MNPYDYSYHHYSDEFSWNYEHHNWSSPLPPLSRPDRPSFRGWFRPVIPAGWHANVGAPFIDGILGIPFGTFFDDALDYLYSQGFYIDGYANSIIYLRNVPMLRMIWDDVMLAFDTQGRLVNAEFVINICTNITHHLQPKCWSHYGSQCRNVSNDNNGITPLRTVASNNNGSDDYDKIYRRLCQVFGTPFDNSSGSVSLYGGNNTGWMTLLTFSNSGYHHTMLSIGY